MFFGHPPCLQQVAMAFPGFPAFSGTDTGLKLGPGHLCTVCSEIPLNELPFEDEEAYPHHLTLDALEMSLPTRALLQDVLASAITAFSLRHGNPLAGLHVNMPTIISSRT